MTTHAHIPEIVFARIWAEQRFKPGKLHSADEKLPIQVIRRGWRNVDSGPDFKDALIRIGEQVHEGDVELHIECRDWHGHGHDTDPAYNQTILHVVLNERNSSTMPPLYKANGEPLITVFAQDCLQAPLAMLQQLFQSTDEHNEERFQECQAELAALPPERLLARIKEIGVLRLTQRAQRFALWLQADDFQQLLYEAICEGLGYSSNKRPFVKLAQRLPLRSILEYVPERDTATPSQHQHWLQALLFGTAGLLPPREQQGDHDPDTTAYLTELQDVWAMSRAYLDVTPLPAKEWCFFRLRPPNFPTRRLAALSILLSDYLLQPLLDGYLNLFHLLDAHPAPIRRAVRLLEGTLRIPLSGYWRTRYRFGPPAPKAKGQYFLGQARIRDILISAVFPVMLCYAQHHEHTQLEEHILTLYHHFPAPPWNRRVRPVVERFFQHRELPASQLRVASIYQGLLHLSRYYCALPACHECPLHS